MHWAIQGFPAMNFSLYYNMFLWAFKSCFVNKAVLNLFNPPFLHSTFCLIEIHSSLGFWGHGVESSGSSLCFSRVANLWVNFASSPGSVSETGIKFLLTWSSIAIWELNPSAFVLLFQLDHRDVRGVLFTLVNLDGEISWNPLGLILWLTVIVPVNMWSVRSISWVDLLVLMLNNLVFMIVEELTSMENWVINWLWSPIRVVSTPLLLVNLLSGLLRFCWYWLGLSWCESLACSNNSVAKVILKWNIICSKAPLAIW